MDAESVSSVSPDLPLLLTSINDRTVQTARCIVRCLNGVAENIQSTSPPCSVDEKKKSVPVKTYDKHWQTSRANVRERNQFMFKSELLSDVRFKVGKFDENFEIIYAHKYVLATASPVFFAMLYGELAENTDVIDVKDCDPESFTEFLRFVYCDQANLNSNSVLGVLYLAKKYIIPVLVKECISYLMENITIDNVLEVLHCARCFSEEKLERHCWSLVSRKTLAAVNTEAFLEVEKSLLTSILKKDSLTINEIDLFHAVKAWSEKECLRSGLEVNDINEKTVLGDLINLIRFPVMSAKEFAEGPARSNVLDVKDIKDIFIYLNAGIVDTHKFSLTKRDCRPFSCQRYRKVMRNYLWRYDERDIDGIRFKVSEEIHLAGVGLYGSPCGGEYSVNIVLSEESEVILTLEATFTCPPDPEFSSVESPQIFDILFDEEPMKLKENVFYSLCLLIEGPPSFGGDEGQSEVVTEGVKFSFENSGESTNGTSFDEGQIPTLLFFF
ncbi:BTB/POZ domain-containing protein 6-B-like [Rhopilema esculentum]|uniref:BTB/POZ domain-containing protein 6-B-like n=1 Tax=Rhopilema esculentum TaxID=499914 RepID=UPI0031DFFA78|eukprot:gene17494-9109_t